MAMDYATLTAGKSTAGSIRNWVNNSSVDADTVLVEAQTHIYTLLRVQEMIKSDSSFAVDEGDSEKAVPDRCLDIIEFRWITPDQFKLRKIPLTELDRMRVYESDGTLSMDIPAHFSIADDKVQFAVRCDEDRTAFLRYYERPANLAASPNDTNFLTVKHPRILRAACMAFANEFLKHPAERDHWLSVVDDQIVRIQVKDDDAKIGMEAAVSAE